MKPHTLEEIIQRLQSPVVSGSGSFSGMAVQQYRCTSLLESSSLRLNGVAIDSRHVREHDVFAALQGANCHGLDHAAEAIGSGASVLMSERGKSGEHSYPVLEVDDVEQALIHLAMVQQCKEMAPPKTVAVTGSVGKTTACHIAAQLSKGAFRVHSPRGSFNNLIGLPVTILEAPGDTELLWLEMGTNHPGEISTLTAIGQPQVAVVTAVGATHLEGLGSIEGVLEEKFSIFAHRGTELAIAPAEFKDRSIPIPCWWTGPGGDVVVTPDSKSDGKCLVEHHPLGYSFTIQTSLRGQGVLRCLESVLAVSLHLGISPELVEEIAPTLDLPPLRQEEHTVAGLQLVLDCYNASPPSMHVAISDLMAAPGQRKIAILGTMEELGSGEEEYHCEVGRYCVTQGVDYIYCCGRGAEWLAEGVNSSGGEASILPEGDSGLSILEENLEAGDRVLFKASRRVELEQLALSLKHRLANGEVTLGEGAGTG